MLLQVGGKNQFAHMYVKFVQRHFITVVGVDNPVSLFHWFNVKLHRFTPGEQISDVSENSLHDCARVSKLVLLLTALQV